MGTIDGTARTTRPKNRRIRLGREDPEAPSSRRAQSIAKTAAPARRPPSRPRLPRRTKVQSFPPPLQPQTDCARRYSRNWYRGKPILHDLIQASASADASPTDIRYRGSEILPA